KLPGVLPELAGLCPAHRPEILVQFLETCLHPGKECLMKALIAGATSAIAQETAKCFARDGAELFLVARSAERLAAIRDDLKVRGAVRVETFTLDLTDLNRHQEMFDAAIAAFGDLDALLIAHGTLGDQRASQASVAEILKELNTNFISAVSILTIAA